MRSHVAYMARLSDAECTPPGLEPNSCLTELTVKELEDDDKPLFFWKTEY